MTRDEIINELKDIQGAANLLDSTVRRMLPEGKTLAEIQQLTLTGEQVFFLYNNASCLEWAIRQLLERATAKPSGAVGGENIIDFNAEAPKHRGKPKSKGANRND